MSEVPHGPDLNNLKHTRHLHYTQAGKCEAEGIGNLPLPDSMNIQAKGPTPPLGTPRVLNVLSPFVAQLWDCFNIHSIHY